MKIYISGKISGLDHADAVAKFARVGAVISGLGHEAVNPFDVCETVPGKGWHEYMGECIEALLLCDAIVMQPDWHESRGARIEYVTAREMGLKVWFEHEMQLMAA